MIQRSHSEKSINGRDRPKKDETGLTKNNNSGKVWIKILIAEQVMRSMRTEPDSPRAPFWEGLISRREFLRGTAAGLCFSALYPFSHPVKALAALSNPIFWIKDIPDDPFHGRAGGNSHAGIDYLLRLMGSQGLKFYRSSQTSDLSGPSGMIESHDVVLIKVNAQWKYRGCTNSDLIRGLIQRILSHPDGFDGEVVIFENGQSQGSLNGDALGWGSYPDNTVHANANDESHSFAYLVNSVFDDERVSSFLLDPIRSTFIGSADHVTNGYRTYENVSYPCFTTAGNHRVELKEGIWQDGIGYTQNLKLINVPVLKVHGGSEITASLKHFYGVLSMADGVDSGRHYSHLGNTCGKMAVSVRTPVINVIDAIWVCHASLSGYPASATFRANQILASQDPVALDYWATKYILYPKTLLSNHLPSYSGIDSWLTEARDTINGRGGLSNLSAGISVGNVTKNESEMSIFELSIPFRISLKAGWNLVSFPTLSDAIPVSEALASVAGLYERAYAYKAEDAVGPWKMYDPAAPPYANDLETVDGTMGLWIRMKENGNLSLPGPFPSTLNIPLYAGWNLISYGGYQARPVAEVLSSISGKYQKVSCYKAADSTDPWKEYAPGASPASNDLTDMEPGLGYWVLVNQNCTLVINN